MTKLNIKPAVVVAYYGGADVLEQLCQRGFEPVRIQLAGHDKTNQFLKHYLNSNNRSKTETIIQVEGQSISSLAHQLRELGVTHIIPADEAGVAISDLLCEELGLPFNGMALSNARRNKSLMHKQIDSKGIRIPLQTTATSSSDVILWMQEKNLEFPVVIKPLDGAGSAGVTKCFCIEDIHTAFDVIAQILSKKNTVISVANAVIAQEFLQGTEYVVDTVSLNGTHKLTDIWRCKKGAHNNSAFVYEYFDLIDENDTVCSRLFDYAKSVLDALDIKVGPGHLEIYMQHDTTPILVEIGSRLGGPRMPFGTAPCVESLKAQTEYTLDAYVEPEKFHDKWDLSYKKTKHSRMMFLINYENAICSDINQAVLSKIRQLSSYHHEEFAVTKDDELKKTVDVRSSPGFIYLIHDDKRQIERDYQEIRYLENSLFQTAVLHPL